MLKSKWFSLLLSCFLSLALCSCYGEDYVNDYDDTKEDGDTQTSEPSRLFNVDGKLNLTLIVPSASETELQMAAEDFLEFTARMSQVEEEQSVMWAEQHEYYFEAADKNNELRDIVILAGVLPEGEEALVSSSEDPKTDQGFVIKEEEKFGHILVRIESSSQLGVAYGLYELLNDFGVQFYHAKETYVPLNTDHELTKKYQSEFNATPSYASRGFHQHTQHPIVWSDFLLDPKDEYKTYISEYFRFLLRNRQNAFQWHFLKTVDFANWKEYGKWIVEEGHKHGIKIGMVLSFADQQQNNYKLVENMAENLDLEARKAEHAKQIKEGLDKFYDLGLDYISFQFGTTEMTKVTDEETLNWFTAAVEWLNTKDNKPEFYAWIHTPGDLKQEDGETPFFHLPLKAESEIGLHVHTTMFYDLKHPAPVYNNTDFHHHLACFTEAEAERELVYFPESAWWLGFDNTLPLFLPITNYSRAYDIQQAIPEAMGERVLDGHITFTTGIEWNYWMFDHFLTKVTWDNNYTWQDYAEDISKAYGDYAETVDNSIVDITERQVSDLYDSDGKIFYYLAGESSYDEIGAMTGLAARSVKIPYNKVYEYTEEQYNLWYDGDYTNLLDMEKFYNAEAEKFADVTDDTEDSLLYEYVQAVRTTAKRLNHNVLLYGAVIDAREDNETDAYDKLAKAQEISQWVKDTAAKMADKVYRYPFELIGQPKESLTAYQFGYLYETQTAYFWTRRDEQLKELLDLVFDKIVEEFSITTETVYLTDKESTTVVLPDSAALKGIIGPYIPPIVLGFAEVKDNKVDLVLAQDFNKNGLPDNPATSVTITDASWTDKLEADFDAFKLYVKGESGTKVGELTILNGTVSADISDNTISRINLKGKMLFSDIITMLIQTGLFTEESAWEMIASFFDIDPDIDPRPVDFDFEIESDLNLFESQSE